MRVRFGPIILDILDGWADVTNDKDSEGDPPLTLAKQSEDACGVLQFSFALYRSGPIPDPSSEVLLEMLREFGESYRLGAPCEETAESGALRLAAATFRPGDWITRAWYLSDGGSVAKVTYTARTEHAFASELAECEQMVRTICFPNVEGY
jgi:hypothetical protein